MTVPSMVLPASLRDDGFVQCPHCGVRFMLEDKARWTGWRHATCGGLIDVGQSGDEHAWFVAADVIGGGLACASMQYAAGATVFVGFPVVDAYHVLGPSRWTGKLTAGKLSSSSLESFRAVRVDDGDVLLTAHRDGRVPALEEGAAKKAAAKLERR